MKDEAAIAALRDAVNERLHTGFGVAPCVSGCSHIVAGRWTALGIANVFSRGRSEQGLAGVLSTGEAE